MKLPRRLVPPVLEHMKNTTPTEIMNTGRNARQLKRRVRKRPIRNSQMVAVYCIPTAMGADVMDRARITLTHNPR